MSNYTRSVTVFCGSHLGNNPIYAQAAKDLGIGLVKNNFRLVYGGGNVGMMGIISNTVIDMGGAVKGIIPAFLQKKEGKHSRVHDLVITEDMHSRKSLLYKEADAFVCMPGGVGTFDEIMEIITWKQIGLHTKPIFIPNINNWNDALIHMLKETVRQEFAPASLLKLFEITADIPNTLERLNTVFKQ